jgi:hypothetical protein
VGRGSPSQVSWLPPSARAASNAPPASGNGRGDAARWKASPSSSPARAGRPPASARPAPQPAKSHNEAIDLSSLLDDAPPPPRPAERQIVRIRTGGRARTLLGGAIPAPAPAP